MRKVINTKQGNKDKNSPWAKAHLRWVTHLLVRLGNHVFETEEDCNAFLLITDTPEFFEATKLPELSIYQISFLDEIHKEQVVGTVADKMDAFPGDKHGTFRFFPALAHDSFCCCVIVSFLSEGRHYIYPCFSNLTFVNIIVYTCWGRLFTSRSYNYYSKSYRLKLFPTFYSILLHY
jgi:hypothetical protein